MPQLIRILMVLALSTSSLDSAPPATRPTTQPVEAGRVMLYAAIVKPGETWIANRTAGKPNDMSRHFAYVKKMREEGNLIFGGPFADGSGGLLVYRAESLDEAKKLMSADPACVEKVFEFEMHPWLLNAADLPR